MVLISFSEPTHVEKILNGEKRQTTRHPRKTPLREGDEAQLYYRSRMSPGCLNCINHSSILGLCCPTEINRVKNDCENHRNFYGTAKITRVEEVDFELLSRNALEAWAVADGFDNWEQANKWFIEHYGPNWTYFSWVVITWEPNWLKEEVIN